MEGYVYVKEQEFILRTPQGHFEFTLVAEGIRKLGLLYRLIQNGTLSSGSVVFWDEPETNLHPKMLNTVIKILMELQREGVQIFLATHNYGILKEIDLQIRPDDRVLFHALYRNSNTKEILCNSTPAFLNIDPNAILATFDDIYNREIERSLEGIKE
jgi:AAA15 family ATPase/GTPase